jgi:hypothetical protein
MLDIAFHIAVLVIIVFAVGLFIFHHSFYDYMLGNMKSAVKEKIAAPGANNGGYVNAQQPARRIERKESEIEKVMRESLDEPVGSGTTAGVK